MPSTWPWEGLPWVWPQLTETNPLNTMTPSAAVLARFQRFEARCLRMMQCSSKTPRLPAINPGNYSRMNPMFLTFG